MRLIVALASAAATLAIGTAAPARPGPGHGASPPGVWSSARGHHSAKGVRTRFGIGRIMADPEHGRHHRRHRGSGRHGFDAYGGLGIAGPIGAANPYGNGFFTDGGGQIRLRGGQPYFDYDRSYPYEFAPAAGARPSPGEATAARSGEPSPRCTIENSVRVCRGW